MNFQNRGWSLQNFLVQYESFLLQQRLAAVQIMSLMRKTSSDKPSCRREVPSGPKALVLLFAGLAKPNKKVDSIIKQLREERNLYENSCENNETKLTAEGRVVNFITSLDTVIHQIGDGNRGNVWRDMTELDKGKLHAAIGGILSDIGKAVDKDTILAEAYIQETNKALNTLQGSLHDFRDAHGRLPNIINEIIETLDKGRFFGFAVNKRKRSRG